MCWQRYIQNAVKHLRWNFLLKYLATFSLWLFSCLVNWLNAVYKWKMHSYIFPSKIFDRVLNIPLGQYVWELVFRNFNSFFTNSFIPGRCLLLNFALLLQSLKKWLHDYRVKKKKSLYATIIKFNCSLSKHSNCLGFGMLSRSPGLNQFVPVLTFFTKNFLYSLDFSPSV